MKTCIIKNFLGNNVSSQVLHYLPVPTIESAFCNSSRHFNGLLPAGAICAGYTGSQKTPCYVSIYY